MKRFARCLTLFFAGVPLLVGCAKTSSTNKTLERDDEIISFEAPQKGKDIIRIGFAMNVDWHPLIALLKAQFPDKQFIYDFNTTSGINLPVESLGKIVEKNDYDFVVSNWWHAPFFRNGDLKRKLSR
jgi:hypothetical protein